MDRQTLIDYIKGITDKNTSDLVEGWLFQNSENISLFTKVKDEYIYSTMPDEPATEAQMQIANRIVSKSYNEKRHKGRQYIMVAASVLLLISLASNVILLYRAGKTDLHSGPLIPADRVALSQYPTPNIHTIYTNRGTKGEVILPDSSLVKLNSGSKIIFPDRFTGPTREVFVTGEAYFKVKSNPDVPMVVSTNKNMMVKVLGTEFNIRDYENEPAAKVTLYQGKVDILTRQEANGEFRKMAELKPSESYITRKEDAPLKVLKSDTLTIAAWSHGILIFDNTPMDIVIKELERWHGASIKVRNKNVYNYNFTAKFRQESLVQILESIKFCTGIKYEINDNNVELY